MRDYAKKQLRIQLSSVVDVSKECGHNTFCSNKYNLYLAIDTTNILALLVATGSR